MQFFIPVPVPKVWEWAEPFPFPFPNVQKSFPLTPVSNDLCQCTFLDCNLLDKSFLCDWCLSAHVGIYLIDCHKNNNSKKLLINMISGSLTSFVQPAKKLIKLIQILICSFSSNKRENLEWSMYIVHMVFHMSPNNYGWSVIQWSKFQLLASLVILYHINVVWKTGLPVLGQTSFFTDHISIRIKVYAILVTVWSWPPGGQISTKVDSENII